MARRTQTYAIRLAVEGGGQVKAELVSVGQSGEQSLKRIESAGERASGGLKGLGRQPELLRTGKGRQQRPTGRSAGRMPEARPEFVSAKAKQRQRDEMGFGRVQYFLNGANSLRSIRHRAISFCSGRWSGAVFEDRSVEGPAHGPLLQVYDPGDDPPVEQRARRSPGQTRCVHVSFMSVWSYGSLC